MQMPTILPHLSPNEWTLQKQRRSGEPNAPGLNTTEAGTMLPGGLVWWVGSGEPNAPGLNTLGGPNVTLLNTHHCGLAPSTAKN
jgi:hypothetical protein